MRRLVVCCDGTWNSSDGGRAATNVVRMARVVKSRASDGTPQIVWYHPGVGTGDPLDRMLGGAVGVGLSPGVRAAYAFIVNNYLPGDEIFLFGFSRGAYTARSVAGLIYTVGLLRERDMGRFLEVWDWYRLGSKHRHRADLDRSFPKRTTDVKIRCIGVWDTVGAMGVPRNRIAPRWHPCVQTYRFYDTDLCPNVEHGFQALAIDERRAPFQPVPWTAAREDQDVQQVWFSGVHSDVGGGYGRHGTSDIPFIWMASQVAPLLELDEDALAAERDTRQRYGEGDLHESYTRNWWLAGSQHRRVGKGVNQYVHETAISRQGLAGYKCNPDFAFGLLPVWKLTDFERKWRWEQADWSPESPPLPEKRPSFCNKFVRWLEQGEWGNPSPRPES